MRAFGNAKTYRNDNSSRFTRRKFGSAVGQTWELWIRSRELSKEAGKYLDIEFDYKGDPLGGGITNLSFFLFQRSFEMLGFSQEDIVNVFKIVASVLKLGNISFIPTNNIDGTEGCTISNDYELFDVCDLLGTDVNDFSGCLTQRILVVCPTKCCSPTPSRQGCVSPPQSTMRELYEVCELVGSDHSTLQEAMRSHTLEDGSELILADLSASEATHARDSLCKALYSRLFTWLVNRINESIKAKRHGKRKVLGILDVYGFEMFERNGFEQFIINFCNEKLHQVVTESTLKEEQEEYAREGIEWTPIDFFSNSVVCDLIEKNHHGILSMLDEECLKSGFLSDEVFLSKLAQCCAGNSHCEVRHRGAGISDNNLPANCFRLKHYAGTVTYNVCGFVDKNNDILHRDLSQAMYRCRHPLLKVLFPEGNPKRSSLKRPATTGTQFKISISALVRNLSCKHQHYIRCIKPNELKQPRIFEMALVQHQVRYLGLLETVRIRRSGFCYRLQYQLFLSRYKMLSPRTWPTWHVAPVEGVSYLIRDLPIPSGEFAFGRTKLFVRSPRTVFKNAKYFTELSKKNNLYFLVVFELEEFRRVRLEDLAVLIQKLWRGYRQRKKFLLMKRSQTIIASAWRSWRAREEYRILKHRKQVEWAVRVIQRHYICWKCHKYRLRFDQTARNRMREKVTASIIFKDRKTSYLRSVSHPFLGDYVRLRQNVQWKKACVETNDQYVVFADIINKIARSSGKFVPILFVLSTSSMLILDQRTLQIKYRVPATEIYRLSLSPYLDDVAVFHVRAPSPTREDLSGHQNAPGCLFQSDLGKKKGDFVFQTGHVIEIVTKLFLVVQNAMGKPPEVNISTEFETNFGQQTVMVAFKCMGLPEVQPGQIRISRKGNKMEILV
uniref:Unconventional myosin-Ib n=1 Tax=Timema monikensis TaxID=170555 RepID=A0A7R9E2Q6_9NEOP|nr:unnamed protein product [Timema monikensis]